MAYVLLHSCAVEGLGEVRLGIPGIGKGDFLRVFAAVAGDERVEHI